MTEAEIHVIRSMREQGYVVVVFTPDELEGIEDYADSLSDGLVADGNDRIEMYRDMAGLTED